MNTFKNYVNEGNSSTMVTTMDSETVMNGATLLTTIQTNVKDISEAQKYRDELNAAISGVLNQWYPTMKGETNGYNT